MEDQVTYQPQHFAAPDGTRLVVITDDEYRRLRSLDEEARDIAEGMAALAQHGRDGVEIPAEVASLLVDGATPVGAWRAYRGISQVQLARAVDMSPAAINALDQQPDRFPHRDNRKRLADVFGISLATLDACWN